MSIANMTLQEESPQPSSICSNVIVSTNRARALNPDATAFVGSAASEPSASGKLASLAQTDKPVAAPYMNGDVSHASCGNEIPAAESQKQNQESTSMMEVKTGEQTSKVETAAQEEFKTSPSTMENLSTCPEPSHDTGQVIADDKLDSDATQPEPLSEEKIRDLLADQVAIFFSRENWSSDPYLLSQMDSDQYVPVFILAACEQFANITKNHLLINEALKESEFVQLDEAASRVRPNYKRCIVILREIPASTPSEEIEALFKHEDCPKVIGCEFINNGSWYITFDNDDDAQKAYSYLRETVKFFKEKPILARIKTKPISRKGCFNVLPSKGNNPMSGKIPNGQLGAMAQGVHAPGQPALPSLTNPGAQTARVFIPPNAPYYNYASSQIPTFQFYPNPMVQWQGPNVYDMSTFLNYNGLTPRSTYKPTTPSKFRRGKKEEKTESGRHASGGSTASASSRPAASRPLSANSPHALQGAMDHSEQSTQGSNMSLMANCFTPSDIQNLAGEPLYSSYASTSATLNRPDGAGVEGERLLPADSVIGLPTTVSNIPLDPMVSAAAAGVALQNIYDPSHAHIASGNPSYHPAQRNGYGNEPHHRPISRGGGVRHKRGGRPEGEISHRNGFHRGAGPNAAERAAIHDRRVPQFDLQATSFPPLPGAADAPGNKTPSGDSQKFSDIMKGTAKFKTEKSIEKDDAPTPQSSLPGNVASQAEISHPAPSASCLQGAVNNPNASTAQIDPQSNPIQNDKALTSTSSVKDAKTTHAKTDEKKHKHPANSARVGKKEQRPSANKENRPQQTQTSNTRSWREERTDSDGWVTMGGSRDSKNRPDPKLNPSAQENKTLVNGDVTTPPTPSKNEVSSTEAGNEPKKAVVKEQKCRSLSPDSMSKPSWANMARSGKSEMEKLSAELKEKEEHEKQKKVKMVTKGPQVKLPVAKEVRSSRKEPTPASAPASAPNSGWAQTSSKRPKSPPK